ncbi:MAG TPA: tRNA preQ1(34) S-adenosylmethionine ribosyltransferase-isomerase QueA [Stellaceae bacterium]|jgi:S-adenosylmethionine:tRNA ribosyltransferase-isomerase|nr:tRNA preQ1(34) S-adenosylmethionine ribosyltransferase-isomerase QueA [Stellaceae bacterium]
MRVDDFDFDLPADRIAQRPAVPRDSARLLHIKDGAFQDRTVRDLATLLRPGDLLLFNDTKVVPARLQGVRPGEGGDVAVSVTLHQPAADNLWYVFAKPGKRLKPGQRIDFAEDFSAEVLEKRESGDILLRFDCRGLDLVDALRRYGAIPLPPYIRGGIADAQDTADYQTMFAERDGAVAAPTAALHFTPALLDVLKARGIDWTTLTLHVGAGTFQPVKVDDTRDHVMHAEWGTISAESARRINEARRAGGRIIAVGTTSLRLVESAVENDGHVTPFTGSTDLFITPGYRFKAVDLLLTNFHLPRSTLFMLVSAFAGLDRMRAAYTHAVAAGYRFYSYGDCCLLEPVAP